MLSQLPTRRPRSTPAGQPRRRWWRRHKILTGLIAVFVILAAVVLPSLIPALTQPGGDSLAARLAEWARTHGLGGVVNELERIQYDLNPPKVGGHPSALPSLGAAAPGRHATGHAVDRAAALPLPAAIRPLAHPALRGEGHWRVVDTVAGIPAIAVTYLRSDDIHTSYVSSLVWMNPRVLRFALHPGSLDPGPGAWGQPDTLPPGQRRGLLAAFNSGFRLYASDGGYYAYGHTAQPLRRGAASVVIYRNGSATVGTWGSDVGMTPNVAAVRQNLVLIVAHGRPVPGLNAGTGEQWGATLGNAYYVARSGLGVTHDGALVYATGPVMSAYTLARLLSLAGCTRAMELDINPAWTDYVLYNDRADPADPVPRNLLPSFQWSPERYYGTSSRDFFSVYARPPAGSHG
jgi:hypothetical protein